MAQGQCPTCNTLNNYSEMVCATCGKRLPWAANTAQPPFPASTPPQIATTLTGGFVTGKPIGIANVFKRFFLGMAVLIAMLLAVRMFFMATAAVGISFESQSVLNDRAAKEVLSNELKAKGLPYTCVSATLLQESGNNYRGTALFSDGSEIPITAIIDGSGRILVYYVFPYQWFATRQP